MPGYATITVALNPCNGSEERFSSFTISLDNDGDGLTDMADPDCQPTQTNRPPVLSAIGNRSVNEGSLLSFTATATDPDAGQTRTFSLDAGAPAGSTINGSTGVFNWTPTEAQGPGSYPITIRVTDNGSPAASDFETITVTVSEVNVAPVLAPIGNRTGTAGSPVTFTATATDADVPAQTRTFSLGAGAPAGAAITAGGAFSWTPAQAGSFPVTVIVTDSGSPALNDTEAFTITVSTGNTAPVAAGDSYSVNAGATLTVPAPGVLGNDTDAQNNPLTAALVSGPASGTLNLSSNGSFTYTPTVSSGSVTFTYRANDGSANSNTATVTITVNAAPVTGAITVMPAEGAVNVPVNTVVSATLTGTGDIQKIFNAQTFTLRVSGSATEATASAPQSEKCVDDGVVKGAISYNSSNTTGTFTPSCLLMSGTNYNAGIASSPGGLSAPEAWTFTTIASSPDTDDDGVPDNEDDFPGNKGKGSPPSSRGKGKFLVDITGTAGASLASAAGVAETDASLNQAGMPSGYEFPDGLVGYQVVDVVPGGTATVKITFPSGVPAGSKVYKAGPNGFQEVVNPTIQGATVTLTLTDGGAGDSDGVANGVIVDPVGVAVPVQSGSGSLDFSNSASGGGCAVAPGNRGEGAWAMAPLLVLLFGMAVRRLRKPGSRE
ncbi:MAG TPA: choice-of-anchor U domain-containing protein [Candidatus Deferrimicrobiaceae bacterium]